MQQKNTRIKFIKDTIPSNAIKDRNIAMKISKLSNRYSLDSFRCKVEYKVKFVEGVVKEKFESEVIKMKNNEKQKENKILAKLKFLKKHILIVNNIDNNEQIPLKKLAKIAKPI